MSYTQECSNIYFILKNLDQASKSKIPKDIFDFFELNRDENYEVKIDLSKPIYLQVLDDNTTDLLAEIYQKYLCSDEEKIQFIRQKNNNLNTSNKVVSDYYSQIFNNVKKREETPVNESTELMVIEKEEKNVFLKLKKLILSIFNKY